MTAPVRPDTGDPLADYTPAWRAKASFAPNTESDPLRDYSADWKSDPLHDYTPGWKAATLPIRMAPVVVNAEPPLLRMAPALVKPTADEPVRLPGALVTPESSGAGDTGVTDASRVYEKNGHPVVDTSQPDPSGHVPTHRLDQPTNRQPGETWEQYEARTISRRSFSPDTAAIRDLGALEPDVQTKARALIAAAKQAGHTLDVSETKRTQDRQEMLFQKGRATPGNPVTWTLTSDHTPGRAVDFVVNGDTTGKDPGYQWLQENAPKYGFNVLGSMDPGHVSAPAPAQPVGRQPLLPMPNLAASRDATQTRDTSVHGVRQNVFDRSLLGLVGTVADPVGTAKGIGRAVLIANRAAAENEAAANVAAAGGDPRTVERTVSPEQARDAAIQTAALLALPVAGEVEGVAGRAMAPAIGSRAAGLLSRTGTAAGYGAALSPQDPAAGALAGAIGGAVTDAIHPSRPTVRGLVTRDPSRMLSDETSARAPTATGRILDRSPVPTEPDFTVDPLKGYTPNWRTQESATQGRAEPSATENDLLNEYQQSELGQRERVNNATQQLAEHADFPMTVQNILDHAEAKGTSIAESADVLRRAGYSISSDLERQAVKAQMKSQPSSEPPYEAPAADDMITKARAVVDDVGPSIPALQRRLGIGYGRAQGLLAQITPQPTPDFHTVIKMSPEEIQGAADQATAADKNLEASLFGEEGAKRYKRLQSAANSAYDPEKAARASDQIAEMESQLTPAQQNKLYGFGETGLSAEELRDAARWANVYAPHNTAEMSTSELLSTVGRELTTGSPHNDVVSALRLRGAAQELSTRTGKPLEQIVKEGLESRVNQGYASPGDAVTLLRDRMEKLRKAGLFESAALDEPKQLSSGQTMAPEKTDLFGNAVAPTVEQGSLLAEGAGTAQSRTDQQQLARKDQPISAEEMAQRRDELGAAKPPAQPPKAARRKPVAGAVNPKYKLLDTDALLDRAAELERRLEEYASGAHGGPEYVSALDRGEVYDPKAIPSAVEHPHTAGTSVRHRLMQDSQLYREVVAELQARGIDEDAIDEGMAKRGRTFASESAGDDTPFERSAPGGKIHMETGRGSRPSSARTAKGARPTPNASAATAPIGSTAGPAGPAATGAAPHPTPEAPGLEGHRSAFRPLEVVRAVKMLLNPESLGEEARGAAGTIGHESALSWRNITMANEALRDFGRYVGRLTKQQAVAFWDAAERGRSTGDSRADQGNALLHQITEQYTRELIRLDRLKAQATIDNYIGRFWATPKTPLRDVLSIIRGRRPLEGSKSFAKQRTLEHFTDGLDAGLTPATYNYVDAQLAKIAEMQRVIAAEKMLRQEAEFGRAKKVMIWQEPPVDAEGEQWVRLGDGTDPAFNIYLPPELSHWEAVDTVVYGKLSALVKELQVTHSRPAKIGRDALGYARGDREIVTRFGGAEGVLAHELGHILDARYGLRREIERGIGNAPRRVVQKGKRAGQSVPDYTGETPEARTRRKDLREELRQLANLRRETLKGVPATKDLRPEDKKYLHSWPEKMANMVEAYIHARDRFEKVAPGIFALFDRIVEQHPELHALRDIAPSLSREEHTTSERIPGIITGGHWYAPKDAAAVWKNHLSRGWSGNPLFDAYMAPAQAAQQLMLGLSGFHATVISTEGAFSELAAAAENLINAGGKAGTAVRHLGKAGVAPVTTTHLGMQVMQEYRKPGTHPQLAKVLDAMIAGGYRGKTTSELWTGERIENFRKALTQALTSESKGRRLLAASKLPLNSVWAAIETTSIPVLARYVPLMKAGALYSAAAEKVAKLDAQYKGDVPVGVLRREMRDLVKEMDYRFGQVDYDNFFINNAVKNLAQMVFLAPGWTFGTVALAERGLADVAKVPKRAFERVQHARGKGAPDEPPPELLGKSAAYWIFGAVLGTVVINGVLTYLHTGERPAGKDFWAFRDGTTDQDGNPNRQTIPGYLMKDIYGWSHHPIETFRNKLAPTLAFLGRLAMNRRYNGDEIYDEQASRVQKAKQIGTALAKDVAPLSVQNFLESRRRGEGTAGAAARNLFGITPAKREFQRTPAQNLMQDLLDKRGHTARTPDEREQSDARRAKRAELLTLPRSEQRTEVRAMIRSKEVTPREGTSLLTRTGEDPLVTRFKQLTAAEALKVWNAADPREKDVWRPILRTKLINAGRRADIPADAQRAALLPGRAASAARAQP